MYICIKPNPDGSHALQAGGELEDGWAAIPPDYTLPSTFPYVQDIEVKEVAHPAVMDGDKVLIPEYTQLEVVSMSEGEPVEQSSGEQLPTAQEDTDAMMVDLAYRVTLLELGLTEEVN